MAAALRSTLAMLSRGSSRSSAAAYMGGRGLEINHVFRHAAQPLHSAAVRSVEEGSIGIHKHVPAGHHTTVSPNNSMIHGYAARCFSTLPCTRAASEPGSLASGMPSAITLKPPFVNSIGVKRTFSSSSSTNYTMSLKPKVPTSTAELEAKYASERAAMHAELAAWNAKMNRENSVFSISLALQVFGSGYIFWWLGSMMKNTGSSSSCCSACCKCQSTGQNPRRNEDKIRAARFSE